MLPLPFDLRPARGTVGAIEVTSASLLDSGRAARGARAHSAGRGRSHDRPEAQSSRRNLAKLLRYGVASAISVGITEAVLYLTYAELRLASPAVCNVIGSLVAAGPAFLLNRRWVWGRGGRSHLWREVVPFWATAIAGVTVSVTAVAEIGRAVRASGLSRAERGLLLDAGSLGAFVLLWALRYVVLDRLVFRRAPAEAS